MAKGFDMGVVVVLDYLESLATFFTHPSHHEYGHEYRVVITADDLVGSMLCTNKFAIILAQSATTLNFEMLRRKILFFSFSESLRGHHKEGV